MSRPTYAEIDLAALRHNCGVLRRRVGPGVRILGVVKADGYGHGAVEAGRVMADAGIDMLGVAIVEEGVALRVHGIRVPILVMGLTPEDEVAAAIEYGLTPTVDGPATAEPLERRAAARGATLAVHLKIDTGMNRLGVRAEEAAEAARAVASFPHLSVAGAYTHLACADDPDDAVSAGQLARFAEALTALRSAGVRPEVAHAANSSALLRSGESHFDMVRAGLALYGVAPCVAARDVPLRPVMSLVTHVVATKRVRPGEGASYGHRWRAARESVLGVLPIGYADGYPRALSDRARVRAGGHLAPVVGAVCMDMVLVDLTDVAEAAPGMAVTLIEADPASPLSAAALATAAGTIPYEILTGIGKRVPRVYRGG